MSDFTTVTGKNGRFRSYYTTPGLSSHGYSTHAPFIRFTVSRTIDEIARNIDDDDAENLIPELERLGLQPAQPSQVVAEEQEEKVPEDIPDMDDIPDIDEDEDDGELVEEEDPVSFAFFFPSFGRHGYYLAILEHCTWCNGNVKL